MYRNCIEDTFENNSIAFRNSYKFLLTVVYIFTICAYCGNKKSILSCSFKKQVVEWNNIFTFI